MTPAEAKVAVIQYWQEEPKQPRSSIIAHDYAAMPGKKIRK
jgi:hypothetical protein